MIGGEALPGALASELANLSGAHIQNMYGPTETTIWSTTETVTPTDGNVSIGRPVANTQVYVLDKNCQPVPIGVTGELYIGGAGVARGYWQQPELTGERFINDPFAKSENARLYRTGDLVRWRDDGRLDFLGRSDHQVKLHGYRIELGEIESAITGCPSVRQSVVMVRQDNPGVTRLVAYLSVDKPVNDVDLKAWLAARLPEHMMPAHFVTLDTWPLTPNKKVDRRALPPPVMRKPAQGVQPSETTADGTVAQRLAAIWTGILGVPNIASKDNFFDLGGHSLLAVQAHREIRKTLDVQSLSITDIFRFPTLGALAQTIEEKTGTGEKTVKTPASNTETREKSAARSDAMARRREMRARRQPKTA